MRIMIDKKTPEGYFLVYSSSSSDFLLVVTLALSAS